MDVEEIKDTGTHTRIIPLNPITKEEQRLITAGIKLFIKQANKPGVSAGWCFEAYENEYIIKLEQMKSRYYPIFIDLTHKIESFSKSWLNEFRLRSNLSLQLFELMFFADEVRDVLKDTPEKYKELENQPTHHLIDNLPQEQNIVTCWLYMADCLEELRKIYRLEADLDAFKEMTRSSAIDLLKLNLDMSKTRIKWKSASYLEACNLFKEKQDIEDKIALMLVCCRKLLDKTGFELPIFDYTRLKAPLKVVKEMANDCMFAGRKAINEDIYNQHLRKVHNDLDNYQFRIGRDLGLY